VRLAITPTDPQHMMNWATHSLFQDVIALMRKGDTPRPPLTLRWAGTITRTDMGVQQSLNLTPIANPERSAPMVAFAPMGARPLPVLPREAVPGGKPCQRSNAGSCSVLCERASACS